MKRSNFVIVTLTRCAFEFVFHLLLLARFRSLIPPFFFFVHLLLNKIISTSRSSPFTIDFLWREISSIIAKWIEWEKPKLDRASFNEWSEWDGEKKLYDGKFPELNAHTPHHIHIQNTIEIHSPRSKWLSSLDGCRPRLTRIIQIYTDWRVTFK